jgi:hypothetical protein
MVDPSATLISLSLGPAASPRSMGAGRHAWRGPRAGASLSPSRHRVVLKPLLESGVRDIDISMYIVCNKNLYIMLIVV